MARPLKDGIDYFPFDVNFFSSRSIKALKGKYGADGLIVYIYLLCSIYSERGYYMKTDDNFLEDIAADLNMSDTKIGQIVNFLCKRSLLDSTLFMSDKVLTAHGIQARFQTAVKKRGEKRPIEVEQKYWVLNEKETEPYIKVTQKTGLSEKNTDYSEKNTYFSAEKTPKVKESKVKYSKGTYVINERSSLREKMIYDENLSNTQFGKNLIEKLKLGADDK